MVNVGCGVILNWRLTVGATRFVGVVKTSTSEFSGKDVLVANASLKSGVAVGVLVGGAGVDVTAGVGVSVGNTGVGVNVFFGVGVLVGSGVVGAGVAVFSAVWLTGVLVDKDVCDNWFAGASVIAPDETATGGKSVFKASRAAPPQRNSHKARPSIKMPARPAPL